MAGVADGAGWLEAGVRDVGRTGALRRSARWQVAVAGEKSHCDWADEWRRLLKLG